MPAFNGERLSLKRKVRGLARSELADMLGVSVATIRRWETGIAEPSPRYIPAIAKILKIDAEALFGPDL